MTVMVQIQNSMKAWEELKQAGGVSHDVNRVYERSLRAKMHYQRHFDRSIENWHMYSGLNAEYGLGQWPADAVRFMLSKRRHIFTYNLAKQTVVRLAASLAQIPFDPEFFPVDSEINSLTESLKNIMYCDKERCGWQNTYLEMIIAGCVFQGVMRMDVDDHWDPMGNLAFNMCLPNSWYGDPMWKSARMRDLRICWHEQFLSPDVMFELYGDRNPRFKLDLESFMRGENTYGTPTGAVPFDVQGDNWGMARRMIHEYRMVRRPTKYEFVITAEGDVKIPSNLEYPDEKMNWLNHRFGPMGPNTWLPENIFEKPDHEDICIKTTICPQISVREVIDEKECEVQVGHPPFEVYSFDNINGEPYSLIDTVKDMQINVNYEMSMKQFRLQMEGFGGAKGIDRNGFASEEEFERAKKEHNDAGAEPFEVEPGYFAQNRKPIQPLTEAHPPANEAMQELSNIIDRMWPMVSGNVPAMSGRKEGKQEPNALFVNKINQAEQGLYIAETRLRNFWHSTYEDYLLQAGQQYSLVGIPREFHRFGSEDKIRVNEPITLPDGSQGIRNDMSALKEMRCQIIISEKQDTPTKKAEDLGILNDLLTTRVKTPPSSPSVVLLLNTVTSKVDQLSVADKEKLEEVGELEFKAAFNDLMLKLKQQEQELNPQPQQVTPEQQAGGVIQSPQGSPAQPQVSQGVPKNVPRGALPLSQGQPQIHAPKPPQAPMPANIKPASQRPNSMPPQAAGGPHG
jgi:hypothetical protein